MSKLYNIYLLLEQAVVQLDTLEEPQGYHAEQIRSIMDRIWLSLSDEEHELLNNRQGVIYE